MIFAIVLGLAFFAIILTLPIWPYSSGWGYFPASMLTLIPVLFFFLWVFDLL